MLRVVCGLHLPEVCVLGTCPPLFAVVRGADLEDMSPCQK